MPNNLHITSFGNQNTTKTADELIIQMLENRIKERDSE